MRRRYRRTGQNGAVTQLPDGDGRADTFYAAVGGEETFRRLVEKFYAGLAEDPVLRPLYPEDDLAPAADRLRVVLMQYWGGPPTYPQPRGPPRLRMRPAPFPIGEQARDAWLRNMRRALDSLDLPAEHEKLLWDYLPSAADSLRNLPG